jgi:hypothetical protein
MDIHDFCSRLNKRLEKVPKESERKVERIFVGICKRSTINFYIIFLTANFCGNSALKY